MEDNLKLDIDEINCFMTETDSDRSQTLGAT